MKNKGNSMDAAEKIGVRTTGRIKKAKVVYDPSDNYLPRSYRLTSISTTSTTSTVPANHTLEASEKKLHQNRTQAKDADKRKSGNSSISDSSSSVDGGEKCVICHKRETKKSGKKFVACKDCETSVHVSCLNMAFEDLNTLKNNYKCDNCRTCASCFEGPEDGDLVTCLKCVKSFHFGCHIPSVSRFTNKWFCVKCTPKSCNSNSLPAKSIREIIIGDIKTVEQQQQQKQKQQQQQQQSSLSTAKRYSSDSSTQSFPSKAKQQKIVQSQQQSQQQQQPPKQIVIEKAQHQLQHKEEKPQTSTQAEMKKQQQLTQAQKQNEIVAATKNHDINDLTEIPDVKEWSIEKVVDFFGKYFPKEAHVFQEHEIDGQSLLLLKRSDVIKKLPLKLGPSLRIYNCILKIQSKSNDPTIAWLN